jgi:hypothetical protein
MKLRKRNGFISDKFGIIKLVIFGSKILIVIKISLMMDLKHSGLFLVGMAIDSYFKQH